MNFGSVTKIDKRNTETLKKSLTMALITTNCDVIVIFSIYGQFGAIQRPDSESMVCNTYIFINRS